MRVEFTIPGEPKGKGRPRFSKRGNFVKTYTPEDTAIYENLVKVEYLRQVGNKRFADDADLAIYVKAYFGIPKSVSKRTREKMLSGGCYPTKKPDCDNILKIICDSLNGIAYHDDAQICYCQVMKRYHESPKVVVEIFGAGEEEKKEELPVPPSIKG